MEIFYKSPYGGGGANCDECGKSITLSNGLVHCRSCQCDFCLNCASKMLQR
jgi:hypothetical protein